jgi:hypothetical protein
MATLLQALLRNESGGRNIPNVHQGTSSGQAQGYFQITTGTWDEFGGRKYASNPLNATYEQQAEIASKIPLKRWDKSTLAVMRGTGKPIDPNRTLGENLAMHGETFAGGARDSGSPAAATRGARDSGSLAVTTHYDPRRDTPSAGQPVGSALPGQPVNQYALPYGDRPSESGGAYFGGTGLGTPANAFPPAPPYPTAPAKPKNFLEALGSGLQDMGKNTPGMPETAGSALPGSAPSLPGQPSPSVNPEMAAWQRQQLAMLMQRLNSGQLWI